jgi:hypothetical protein
MNSDTYKSLEVGSTISPMVFSQNTGYKEEPNKVCAINGQYVLTCVEMYYQGDELISNFASPFYFENIDNVVKAFEDLKND